MAEVQFVVFRLADQVYGAQIHNIQEIILPEQPTKVPNNPDFIEGVINHRGEVIPVLDLKKRFRLGDADYGRESRFIVAEVDEKKAAFIVDEVTEILRVYSEQIGEPPEMTKINKDYITGVVMMEKSLVILLDLSKVLTVEEKDIINQSI
ncbi:MAG: chemotaxis protein CheW [Clostridiales bacterium]|jgi:purine-binding chemotaxis protein CheW|nr:chemotaxis protein CheW [Clostridiales bacterium]